MKSWFPWHISLLFLVAAKQRCDALWSVLVSDRRSGERKCYVRLKGLQNLVFVYGCVMLAVSWIRSPPSPKVLCNAELIFLLLKLVLSCKYSVVTSGVRWESQPEEMFYPLTCTGSIPIKIRRSYTDADRHKLSFRINYVIYIYRVCSTRESLLIKPYKAEQEQNVSTMLRCMSTCAHMKRKTNWSFHCYKPGVLPWVNSGRSEWVRRSFQKPASQRLHLATRVLLVVFKWHILHAYFRCESVF